jgi:hypothetical protein
VRKHAQRKRKHKKKETKKLERKEIRACKKHVGEMQMCKRKKRKKGGIPKSLR